MRRAVCLTVLNDVLVAFFLFQKSSECLLFRIFNSHIFMTFLIHFFKFLMSNLWKIPCGKNCVSFCFPRVKKTYNTKAHKIIPGEQKWWRVEHTVSQRSHFYTVQLFDGLSPNRRGETFNDKLPKYSLKIPWKVSLLQARYRSAFLWQANQEFSHLLVP